MASGRARRRYGPQDELPWNDRLWPAHHARWWNWDSDAGRHRTQGEMHAALLEVDEVLARERLEVAQAIARTAEERFAAADRRATAVAGSTSIAASITLAGATLMLKEGWASQPERIAVAVLLLAATSLFVLAAVYALRALVGTRKWLAPDPHWLDKPLPTLQERLARRSAAHLDQFAGNWEVCDVKNRLVDNGLRALVGALAGLPLVALVVLIAVARA